MKFKPECLGGRRGHSDLGLGKGIGRVDKECHDVRCRQQLAQQFEPFRRFFFAQLGHTREIATGSAKAADKTKFDRVSSRFKNDGSVVVAAFAASDADALVATITATLRRTISAAIAGSRSW